MCIVVPLNDKLQPLYTVGANRPANHFSQPVHDLGDQWNRAMSVSSNNSYKTFSYELISRYGDIYDYGSM